MSSFWGTLYRAIAFAEATSGNVTLNESKLYCNEGVFKSSYTRGFSTQQYTEEKVLNIYINKSEIKGFAYPILNGGGISSKGNIVLSANNSTFSGWCCAEIYGNNNVLDYTNCSINGLNMFSGGSSNDYSLFQASYASGEDPGPYYSSGGHNVITLSGCTLTAAAKDDTTANQKIVNFEDGTSVIHFREGTEIVQKDTRPALFQVWDEDGADGSNAKQFTFDETVKISGGNYYFEFNDALFDTAVVCDSPDAKVYQGDTGVFTYAPTLSDAVANAENGNTVTLLKNVTLDTTQNITKNITIDLNGHNITGSDVRAFHVQKGTLNLTGKGTITSKATTKLVYGSSVIRVGNNDGESATAGLVIGKDVVISAPSTYGVTVFGKKTTETVTVYGTVQSFSTHVGDAAAISGVGTVDYAGTTINIEPGAVVSSENDAAIYHPQEGTLNIKGGTITGKGGIEAKAGTINVTGTPTITANNDTESHKPNGNGTSTLGYAIAAVENNNGYAGGTQVNISGGTFTGKVITVVDSAFEDAAKKGKIVVTGGTFSDKPTDHLANSNYYIVDNGNGTFTVKYSAPSIPSTPTDNVTNSGTSGTDNATTSADLSNTTSTSNGTTAATVDKTTADKIVDKAVANKSEEIVIDATANSATAANSTTIAQVTIPTETLGAIAEKTEADVTIKTDVAEVKMDNAAAAAVSEQAEGDTVQIIAEKVKEDATEVHFELKVVCSDGKVISDFKGGNVSVTVTLPKAMADKKVVCVYIDDNGHMSKMEGQKNADGTYTFNTGHFSSYVIMAEEEADAAIAAQKEAIKNIKIKLTSKQVKTKAGKKAVKITWTAAAGDKVLDGVEVFRSTERYKGYGTEPFYTSTKGGNKGSYTNTKSLKKGTRYYYRVRGYVLVNGQKVYTDYSTKAWRTV